MCRIILTTVVGYSIVIPKLGYKVQNKLEGRAESHFTEGRHEEVPLDAIEGFLLIEEQDSGRGARLCTIVGKVSEEGRIVTNVTARHPTGLV